MGGGNHFRKGYLELSQKVHFCQYNSQQLYIKSGSQASVCFSFLLSPASSMSLTNCSYRTVKYYPIKLFFKSRLSTRMVFHRALVVVHRLMELFTRMMMFEVHCVNGTRILSEFIFKAKWGVIWRPIAGTAKLTR